MKKILTITLALAALFCLGACNKSKAADGKLKVVTTIFPEYDWVKNILGANADHAELTLLLDNGVDLHSYSPTVQDMAKISVADVFIYVGGESDEWVEDALKTVTNKNIKVINLLEVLGDQVKEEEVVEGMQEEDEHDHHHHDGEDVHHHDDDDDDDDHHHEGEEHHHHHDDDNEEEVEYDEHVWLSLRHAQTLCAAITDTLCTVDKKNADLYRTNFSAYKAQLAALDNQYADAVQNAARKTVLFGDRFPFRYLVDDYGLSYYAAFVGCSAETEASFKTVAFLSGKVDELALPTVLQIESGDGKIASTIIKNSKAKNATVLTLDSMQSVTAKQIADGANYLGIMRENLTVLKEALN